MQILLFTGDTPEKILEGRKSMTARLWKRKPPKVGDIVRAQKGRKKDTSFAILKILDVFKWSGNYTPHFFGKTGHPPYSLMSEIKYDIAKKEGFESWHEFWNAYYSLNAWCWDEIDRTHWFIVFELLDTLDLEAPDPCK